CITHHGNQVVSGMALNITVSGLTVVLGYAWFQEGGQTPMLGPGARFAPIELPGVATLGAIPGLGLIYREVLSGHNLLVYIAAVAVPAVAWLVYRTRFGLRLPPVGVVPVQLIQAIPYALTVLLLAGFVGRAVAPRAIGVPYVKER